MDNEKRLRIISDAIDKLAAMGAPAQPIAALRKWEAPLIEEAEEVAKAKADYEAKRDKADATD